MGKRNRGTVGKHQPSWHRHEHEARSDRAKPESNIKHGKACPRQQHTAPHHIARGHRPASMQA